MTLVRYLPRFRRAYRALAELEAREHWSRTQIESYQLECINQQWQHATRHVPYFREFASESSLPTRFESLQQFTQLIPVTEKSLLVARNEDFLSEQRTAGGWHRTGGSTGVPLRMFRSTESHCRMLWQKYRMEQAWGVDFFDRKAFVWGHAASFAPGLSGKLQRMVQPCQDWLRNRTRLNAYQLAPTDLERYLDVIAAKRIEVLYGYSSAVTLLANEAQRLGRRFPHLKLAILTAEPADAEMIAACKAGFQAPATIEYGSVECGVIATGMPDGTLRVREDAVMLETLPRDDGRCDLVVTVLDNPAFPLFRYAIEDITDEPLRHEATGFAVLHNVSGRSNDALIATSGRPVHPLAVKHAIEVRNDVRRFRAHQAKDGAVVLTVETSASLSPADFYEATTRLQELLEGYPVTVEIVAQIPANRAGKHRWVTSELAASVSSEHGKSVEQPV